MCRGSNHSDRNRSAVCWRLRMGKTPGNGNCFTAVNGFKSKLLRAPVVAIESQHFPNGSPSRLAFHMDYEVHGLCDFCFGIGEGRLRVTAHDEICKATKGFLGGVRVNCSQRSGMTCMNESSRVRASTPRTSPRMIRSGRNLSASFNRSSKETWDLKVFV